MNTIDEKTVCNGDSCAIENEKSFIMNDEAKDELSNNRGEDEDGE